MKTYRNKDGVEEDPDQIKTPAQLGHVKGGGYLYNDILRERTWYNQSKFGPGTFDAPLVRMAKLLISVGYNHGTP